jgi:hypothetical protein
LPGFARACATRSPSVLYGEFGTTLTTNGYDVSIDTIAMSFSASKGISLRIAALTG